MAGVTFTHYACEDCGHQQRVNIGEEAGMSPVSLDRRPCDRCGGTLDSSPVGLLDKIERLQQEHS